MPQSMMAMPSDVTINVGDQLTNMIAIQKDNATV